MSTVRFTTIIGPDQLIRPPDGIQLAPGQVEVTVVSQPQQAELTGPRRSLSERLAQAAKDLGINSLPPDLAENHDHYAHGAPKGIDRP